jgi:hypothetical protein
MPSRIERFGLARGTKSGQRFVHATRSLGANPSDGQGIGIPRSLREQLGDKRPGSSRFTTLRRTGGGGQHFLPSHRRSFPS